MTNNVSNNFSQLQVKIDKALKENKPIDGYVKEQIKLLQDAHDEFVLTAEANGYDTDSIQVGEIEIKQYSAMRQLAQKIGLSTENYDAQIKAIQERILGSDMYKMFFDAE